MPAGHLGLDSTWGPAHEIERWVAVIEAAKFDLDPLLATAITWLRCHLPPPVPPVLVHADFKANNLLISPEGKLTTTRVPCPTDELMAMTQAELEQYGEAVTWQREALAAAQRLSRPDLVRRLTETLERYEHRQPCRTLALDEEATP